MFTIVSPLSFKIRIAVIAATFLLSQAIITAGTEGTQRLSFETLGRQEGLSNLSVSSIVQDRFGYLWAGTQNGLDRYDGYGFTIFDHDPYDDNSLSHDLVQTLFMDKDDILWAGTYKGLNRFDIRTGTIGHYIHDASDPDSLSNDVVVSVYRDLEGTLWIGTLDGLNIMNESKGTFRHFSVEPGVKGKLQNKVIRFIHEDRSGRVWIGTGGGLQIYDRVSESFSAYVPDPTKPKSIKGSAAMAVSEDSDGALWFGLWDGGLCRYNPDTDDFDVYPMADNRIYSLMSDPLEQKVYVGTWGGGLFVFDRKTQTFARYQNDGTGSRGTIANNTVYSIFRDRSGILWVGTNGGGISKYNPARLRFSPVPGTASDSQGMPAAKTTAMIEGKDGTLWVGTYNQGLMKRRPGERKWTRYMAQAGHAGSLSNNIINTIVDDRDGNIWVGTNHGLNLYRPGSDNFEVFLPDPADTSRGLREDIVISMAQDKDGRLWIGSFTQGVAIWDRANNTWMYLSNDATLPRQKSLSDNTIYQIFMDGSGVPWVGTNKGLNRVDPQSGEITSFFHDRKDQQSLSSDAIRAIFEDSKKRLWIGTSAGGLDLYGSGNNGFTHYTKKNGLSDNNVVSILEDPEGKLWMGTPNGLNVFDPTLGVFRVYTEEDGLQDREFNLGHARLKNGAMLFASSSGYSLVNDFGSGSASAIPPVQITSVIINHEEAQKGFPFGLNKDLTLDSSQTSFSFVCAILDFANPKKNIFAWKLEGYDKDWVYSNNRNTASYMNIPSGTYTFVFKGASAEGIWNQYGVQVKVHILPPPYLSWWAITLYILAGIAVLYSIIRIRTDFALRYQVGELRKVRFQLEQAQAKIQFLSTHDELSGLMSAHYFESAFAEEIARAARRPQTISIVRIWIRAYSDFSALNGQSRAEEIQAEIAGIIKSRVKRNTDVGSRLADGVFVLLLPGSDEPSAGRIAESIKEDCDAHFAGKEVSPDSIAVSVRTIQASAGTDAKAILSEILKID